MQLGIRTRAEALPPARNHRCTSKERKMIHYSCDRCKRRIDPAKEIRHVVRVEVQAVLEPLLDDDLEDDRDHLVEIDDLLDAMDLDEDEFLQDDLPQQLRFDLCAECYRRYIRDPLGLEPSLNVGFSSN
jgi:hypothetical protein